METMPRVSMLPVKIEKIENIINCQTDIPPCSFEFQDGQPDFFVVCNNPKSDPMQLIHIGVAVVPYYYRHPEDTP